MDHQHTAELFEPVTSAVFIPTNLPADDPRDICERGVARFRAGLELARGLRAEHGRANVLVVVFGGWPLHDRLPLAIQHVYAASRLHYLLELDELDFVASYGISSVTDLHGTLQWMQQHLLSIDNAYVVTSKGHAARLVAESGMRSLFAHIHHVESHEPRDDDEEDERWSLRAQNIPPHQYLTAARASEVSRFGSLDSLEWVNKTRQWAQQHPDKHAKYMDDVWNLIKGLEENNVAIRSETPGCWRLTINC
jgi:hypothetical protein